MTRVWMGKNFYKKLFEEENRLVEEKEKTIYQLKHYAELVRYIASFSPMQQLISIVPYSSYHGEETYIVFFTKRTPGHFSHTIYGYRMDNLRDWVYRAYVDIHSSDQKAELIDHYSRPTRKGIGTLGVLAIRNLLLSHGCTRLYGKMAAECLADRKELVAFYQKNGFEISGDNVRLHLRPSDT